MECLAGDSTAGMMVWMLPWAVAGAALLVAIVAGIVWLVRHSVGSAARGDSPEEILRRRYAAGEIDEDEYFRLRAGLDA